MINITSVAGIGESRAKDLAKLGIFTVEDLLTYYPRAYEDRTKIKKIAELEEGEQVCVEASAIGKISTIRVRMGLTIQRLLVSDGTGTLQLCWFNQDYLYRNFNYEQKYTFYGKASLLKRKAKADSPRDSDFLFEMNSPVFEKAEDAFITKCIVPVYRLTANVTQKLLAKSLQNCSEFIDNLAETLPKGILEKYVLCDRQFAVKNIHFPKSFEDFERARRRLAFEELFNLQYKLKMLRRGRLANKGKVVTERDLGEFYARLKFDLTGAQKRVVNEIKRDLASGVPMNRLVQGDVGCGKTVVAASAIYMARSGGLQSVMMAPTHILAEQHHKSLSALFDNVTLLSGGTTAKEKRIIYDEIRTGQSDIIVGTHALLEQQVEFANLGLVIVDEQHRFGVAQRENLQKKGEIPHMLVMSATPIPRTLAHVLYGDLDVSVIDEMPAGRRVVDTYAVDEGYTTRINEFVRKQVAQGRQVYFVCPLVEESETADLKSAKQFYAHLQEIFSGYKVELLYGKMRPSQKDDIMQRFLNREIDILVSTTVVEVGVDCPNASVIVIENAERFGLAQLHQLRGRVGRGQFKSYCVMFLRGGGEDAAQRMEIMKSTNSGFEIARKDLEMRGCGEFFGVRQHGLPELKIANLYQDLDILDIAREACDFEFNFLAT